MISLKQHTPKLGDLSTILGCVDIGVYCLDIQNQELATRIYNTLISSGYIEKSLGSSDIFMDWNDSLIHNKQKIFTVAPRTKYFRVRVLKSEGEFNSNIYFPIYEDSFFEYWNFKFVMVEKSRYICK